MSKSLVMVTSGWQWLSWLFAQQALPIQLMQVSLQGRSKGLERIASNVEIVDELPSNDPPDLLVVIVSLGHARWSRSDRLIEPSRLPALI